ncbi:hypothetical protein GCM10022227_13730 [Streptomyces sedi]
MGGSEGRRRERPERVTLMEVGPREGDGRGSPVRSTADEGHLTRHKVRTRIASIGWLRATPNVNWPFQGSELRPRHGCLHDSFEPFAERLDGM